MEAETDDFRYARAGDHLFCPFECDDCSFYKIMGVAASPTSRTDQLLRQYIRRANLDAFWVRRPGTVVGLTRLFVEQVETGEMFGFDMFPPMGPFRADFDTGMRAALGFLRRSQKPGKHEQLLKYSSARKAQAVHTNVYAASARGVQGAMVFRSEKTRITATEAATDGLWYNNFRAGLRNRVGQRLKQDVAISIGIMVAKQSILETEWQAALAATEAAEALDIAEHAVFFLLLYCASLRGFEGPKVLLTEIRRGLVAPGSAAARNVTPHVNVALSGRFKARVQEQTQIAIPIAYETRSGLRPGVWVGRLLGCLDDAGVETGWLFQTATGQQKAMADFEAKFYELLLQVQAADPSLFAEGIDIMEDYSLTRSHRRGATTRATAAGVSKADIEWVNRWNVGADPGGAPMAVMYADRSMLLDTYLRFSTAL